jgi:hypothetical protein
MDLQDMVLREIMVHLELGDHNPQYLKENQQKNLKNLKNRQNLHHQRKYRVQNSIILKM